MSLKKTSTLNSNASNNPALLHPQRLMQMRECLLRYSGSVEGGRTAISIVEAYCHLFDADSCRRYMHTLVSAAAALPQPAGKNTGTDRQQLFVFHEFTILLLDASREILSGLQKAVQDEEQKREKRKKTL